MYTTTFGLVKATKRDVSRGSTESPSQAAGLPCSPISGTRTLLMRTQFDLERLTSQNSEW